MSKIVRLTSENVKRLHVVEITPEGNVVIVGGDNGHGKTSVLDSIEMALGGTSSIPPEPIRKGAAKARIVVETGDLLITRSFTSNGSYLKVEGKDGTKYSSPQAVLDAMVGSLSFDPLAFMRMDRHAQVTTLRELLGLDFTTLDADRQQVYDQRTLINAEVRRQQDALAGLPVPTDAPNEPVDVAALSEQLTATLERNHRISDRRKALAALVETVEERKAHIKLLQSANSRDEEVLDAETMQLADLAEVAPEPLQEQIRNAEAVNAAVRQKKARDEATVALRQRKAQAEALTSDLAAIDEEKRLAIANAQCPVQGLAFDANSVLLNGLPLEQASSAEQLRISIAMGFAMNPDLRVLLIRDGSLLDATSLGLVADLAYAADGQVWIERVGKGKEAQIIIEDGRVVGAAEAEPSGEDE